MAWTMNRILVDIIGWIGTINLLVAYYLIQTKKVDQDNSYYLLLNITGSLCLTINTLYHRAYPSVITNGAWFIVGMYVAFGMLFGRKDDLRLEEF